MDEKMMAVVGAAAAVTVAGRRMRPLAKVLMRGVVAATEATGAGRQGLQELYAEAKAERARGAAQPSSVGTQGAPAPQAPGTAGAAV